MRKYINFVQLFFTLIPVGLAFVYRDGFLPGYRPILIWLIPIGLLVSLILNLKAFRSVKKSRRAMQLLPVTLSVLGLLAFALVEGRFRYEKHTVLNAGAEQLDSLGRHIVVGYHDPDEIDRLVELRAVAGIFTTRRNFDHLSMDFLREQINGWQTMRNSQGLPPLWIATDQEGGIISRMSPPLTKLPPLAEVVNGAKTATERREKVREYGAVHGVELAAVGINLNFAPVVDINKGMQDPLDFHSVIYRRAISSDAAIVAEAAGDYCRGLAKHGVRCTLKHFPGLGRVKADTHDHSAELETSLETLQKDDWIPFRRNMDSPHSVVMLGHPILSALDRHHPVSFSKRVVTGLLREKWSYDGILITDDYSMDAVMQSSDGIRGAAVKALNAGVDLILIAYDTDLYYPVMKALLDESKSKMLLQEQLAQSRLRLDEHRFNGMTLVLSDK